LDTDALLDVNVVIIDIESIYSPIGFNDLLSDLYITATETGTLVLPTQDTFKTWDQLQPLDDCMDMSDDAGTGHKGICPQWIAET